MYKESYTCSKKIWIAFLFISLIIVRINSLFFIQTKTISAYDSLNSVASYAELENRINNNISSLNNEISSRDAKLNINSIHKSRGFISNKPKENYEFIILNVTIENIGNSIVSYNPFDFKLKGEDNIWRTFMDMKVSNLNTLSNGKLQPGKKITGDIIFEQKKDNKNLILQFTSNIFSNDSAFIELN